MSDSISAAKAAERKRLRRLRDGIPAEERHIYSQSIAKQVLALAEQLGAKTVFAYLSVGSEPETHALIQTLLRQGRQVAVPLCRAEGHTMDAVLLTGWEALAPGAYGILAPDPAKQPMTVVPPEAMDLILVPGLGFDRRGMRLGYGGGYYDRYLRQTRGLRLGLAFSACLTEALPCGVYDQRLDRVLTEKTETKET